MLDMWPERKKMEATRKRPLAMPRRSWEKNVKKDIKQIDTNMRNWVDLVQGRDYWRAFLFAASNFRVP